MGEVVVRFVEVVMVKCEATQRCGEKEMILNIRCRKGWNEHLS